MHTAPDGVPTLAPGRHRTPRDGACAMELASVLAGEPWSDAPPCTHPLLARLARLVNDATSDAGRRRLTLHVPDLVGLTGPDPRWHLETALAVAGQALRVAAPWDQRPLAAAVLTCERGLAAAGGWGRPRLRPTSAAALAAAPDAAEWARGFTAALSGSRTGLPGDAVVPFAVRAVLGSSARDVDAELVRLLEVTIGACRALREEEAAPTARDAGTRPGAGARAERPGARPERPGTSTEPGRAATHSSRSASSRKASGTAPARPSTAGT